MNPYGMMRFIFRTCLSLSFPRRRESRNIELDSGPHTGDGVGVYSEAGMTMQKLSIQ